MKKKYKNIIVIAMVILILLCIYPCYFLVRHYVQTRRFPYKGVDLEETFYEEFPGNYTEVLWVREENLMVFLARMDERQGTRYVYYEKAPFFDWWTRGTDGLLEADDSSLMLITDGGARSNRIYLSLNPEWISKAVVAKGGEETVFRVEPEESFIIITEDGIDDVAFYTKDGEKVSEEKFLD